MPKTLCKGSKALGHATFSLGKGSILPSVFYLALGKGFAKCSIDIQHSKIK
jgi:hypothetical protein